MNSKVFWTVLAGLIASSFATLVTILVMHPSALGVVGWFVFFESMQLPLISSVREGQVDRCTEWLRRILTQKRGDV